MHFSGDVVAVFVVETRIVKEPACNVPGTKRISEHNLRVYNHYVIAFGDASPRAPIHRGI
jgi:hypothetical protein